MGSRASSERPRQLATVATGNSPHQSCWQLLKLKYRTLLRTLKGWYTVVYLVSQSGLVKSDWSVTQKCSTTKGLMEPLSGNFYLLVTRFENEISRAITISSWTSVRI
jgi:hypothetical protein